MSRQHTQDDIGVEQRKLSADVGVVRQYGQSHPEAWVELRFENEPSVHVVALFSGDEIDVHENALRRLVAHPNQLEVRYSPWPLTRLEDIRNEVNALATSSAQGAFSGWGVGGGRVNIRLHADQERLAQMLQARYGDAVDLCVGWLHFPDCALVRSVPVSRPSPNRLPTELHVSVDQGLAVKSGGNLRSKMRLHNQGPDEVIVDTNGGVTARIVDADSKEIVGGYSGAQTLPLIRFHVPATESVEIPLLIGTASIEPRLGYAVPPGRWGFEVFLVLEGRGNFRTPILPITILA